MLCGCTTTNTADLPGVSSATATTHHGLDDARRLVIPTSPVSLRHCFSVRVRPSSSAAVARGLAQSDDSLGLGAEAQTRRPRSRSYTLTGSAIGRILTCFQDAADTSSDDLPRSRPRSRRRSPVSCLSTSSAVVDVVLDCSPGTARRRRLEVQSATSNSSTLHSWDRARVTSRGSEADCEMTVTSSDRDHPVTVWEQRPTANIPPRGDCVDGVRVTQLSRSRLTTAGDATSPRRRATTRAVRRPQVQVVHEQPTTKTPCPVS